MAHQELHLLPLLQDSWRAAPAGFRAKLTYPFVSLSIPLIWGAVLLLALLVAAAVLFAVMAKRKGRWLSTCPSQHGPGGPVSTSLADEAGNLGLLPYSWACLGFGKGPRP